MLSFEVDKDQIKLIILAFAKQYCVPGELNDHLISMVEEKVYSLEGTQQEDFKCIFQD
jgi:hypothetical protein